MLDEAQFWDGRAEDLKAQAKGPVQAGVDMANTPENVVAMLNSRPQYVDWFNAAVPEEGEPVSFDNMAKAGRQLFVDKGCSSCHSGINVGGQGYCAFGLIEKPGSEIPPAGGFGRPLPFR